MKKYIYFVLLFLIFIFDINVFATTTNVTSKIRYDTDSLGGTYKGDEIYNGGYNGKFNVNTRYNGRLSLIEFYLSDNDYSLTASHTYTITLNMSTNDWRNNFMGPQVIKANCDGTLQSTHLSVSNFQFVSRKQIKFSFKTGSTLPCNLFFRFYSTDYASNNSVAITGDTNWNLSSITINDNISSSSGGSTGGGSTGGGSTGSTDATNQQIIDNQNQNNQYLIDNQNQNTTDIIENNNDNTQQIIDNQNQNTTDIIENENCPTLTKYSISSYGYTYNNSYLNSSGSIVSSNGYFVSKYISIKRGSNYTLSMTSTLNSPSVCFYESKSQNSLISCIAYSSRNSFDFVSPNNANYMLLSFSKDSTNISIRGSVCNNWNLEQSIENTQDILNNAIENTQDIKDTIDKDLKTCVKLSYISTIDKYISSNSTTGTATMPNSAVDKTFVYEVPKLDKDYSFVYNGYNRLRIIESDTLYTNSDVIYNSFPLLFNNSSASIGSTYTVHATKKYLYFYLSSSPSTSLGSITPVDSCYPSLEDTNDQLNDINNSITNSNVDNDTGTGFFDNFSSNDFGLSQIITIPLTTIQSLTTSSCISLSVPIPFTNSNITLPCMTTIYNNNFPSIYNLWKIVSFGILSYYIALDIFHIVKGFKDPESDKVEVLDL